MFKSSILILIGLLFSSQIINGQNWKPVTTAFTFTTKMLGVKVEGKLKGFQGEIEFNPNNIEKASITGSVESNTIDTDNSLRNSHLKTKSDFFEVEKYPKIKMVSTKFEKSASGYIGTFNFTIKSITKSISVPIKVDIANDKAIFKGTTTINRKDWKIGGNTLGLSSDVTINFLINANKI
jgi:polyisoprenoid-binding protein YceI